MSRLPHAANHWGHRPERVLYVCAAWTCVMLCISCRSQQRCPESRCPPSDCAAAPSATIAQSAAGSASLRAELRCPNTRCELRFFNTSNELVVLVRPRRGALVTQTVTPTARWTLPAPSYKFEALAAAGGAVYRADTAPWWPFAATNEPAMMQGPQPEDEPELLSEPSADPAPQNAELRVPAKGEASQTVPLPFRLPKGRYSLRFSYEYYLSSDQVPPGFFTGSVDAPAIDWQVGND